MIIGLTGGIASGKSTVSNILKKAGATIVDADKIAHQVLSKGSPGWQQAIDYFGRDILTPEEEIDRSRLAEIIFQNYEKRKELEKIVHPLVIAKMEERIANLMNKEKIEHIILDIPLLYETGMDRIVDLVIMVYVDRDTQLARLEKRDKISREQALARINAQLPLSEKKNLADKIIDNNGSKIKLKKKVLKLWREINEGKKTGLNSP